ncbi:hypothetical protein [Nitrosomonas sp.]|uniref:hypothetical protein n=1 Tax=Nitrosomonas sp. TaxID=42353 RepID=UPI002088FF0F|nr:hypothetical protein [Nitrosomonas sp.]GJL76994.1 MAG: hypothetical protein NMNS02_31000 [Nitrosomonas sp.]
MHNKTATTYVDYKKAIQHYLDFMDNINATYVTSTSLVTWINNLWDAGKSPSTAIKALSFLDTLCVALKPETFKPFFSNSTVKYYISAWEEWWKRKGKSERQFISWDEAKRISQNPPKGVDAFKWKSYILISWSFMLRHGEIRRVSPTSVSFVEEGGNWEIRLGECKTAKEKGRGQVARFPSSLLPKEVIPLLQAFIQLPASFEWNIPKNKVSAHIRAVLNTSNKGYVFHSLRHGRATHLRSCKNINDPDLKMYGRWESTDSLYCYLHC